MKFTLFIMLIFISGIVANFFERNLESTGEIEVSVDYNLERITINGTPIDLSGNINDRTGLKTIPVTIKSGDDVSITASNNGNVENPYGIDAKITYVGTDGKFTTIGRDAQWDCSEGRDGRGRILQGARYQFSRGHGNSYAFRITCSVIIPTGKIEVTDDNTLEQITINDTPIALSGEFNDRTLLKTIPVTIKTGDVVSITGSNNSNDNTAQIRATITYVGTDGKSITISPSAQWRCYIRKERDGRDERDERDRRDGRDGRHQILPAEAGRHGDFANIDSHAPRIWNPYAIRTTCSVIIPNGKIEVTVDDNLQQITINGTRIALSGEINDWKTMKTFPVAIKTGDVVSISGSNNGYVSNSNPAGILATITYVGTDGKSTSISTGAQWKCNGKDPILLGANDDATIWKNTKGSPFSSIDLKAQWIWNPLQSGRTTCSVTIPEIPIPPQQPIGKKMM